MEDSCYLLGRQREKTAILAEYNGNRMQVGAAQQPACDFVLYTRNANRRLSREHERGRDIHEYSRYLSTGLITAMVKCNH
jgi:hypothetical protein